jgi:hypothetical protein
MECEDMTKRKSRFDADEELVTFELFRPSGRRAGQQTKIWIESGTEMSVASELNRALYYNGKSSFWKVKR